jgi:hypothetical protein
MHLPAGDPVRHRLAARFAPLAVGRGAGRLAGMALRTRSERSEGRPLRIPERNPANQLYDEACALLAAAQGVRAAAEPRRSAPAIAASLGCVEASLEELATAVAVMQVAALAPSTDASAAGDPVDRERLQIRASLDQLARDLSASRSSCAAAREFVGPLLANL